MLSDHARNRAFETAIRSAVSSETRVLDIGTGSALLAMMAARAGAEAVVACEADPDIATVARQVVRHNGFQDQIQIVNKNSVELNADFDLEPVDLIVAEVLDPVVIGEGVLPTLRHAVNHLLKPGGRVIPARATLFAGLLELPRLRQVNPVGDVCGFDLSAFDRFRNPAAAVGLRLDHEPHRFLSEPFVVETFDFYQVPPEATNQKPHFADIHVPIIADGHVQAVVCWFDVWLNDDIVLSSKPSDGRSHWEQAAQFLPEDKAVSKADAITVAYGRNDMQLRFVVS